MGDWFKTKKVPQDQIDRFEARKAILNAVGIFLNIVFTAPGKLDLKQVWEEAGNSAIPAAAEYRAKHIPGAPPATDAMDPAELTCNMRD